MSKVNTIRLAVPLFLLLLINSCSKKELSASDTSNKAGNQKEISGGLVATQRALGNSEIRVAGKGSVGEDFSFVINASRKTSGAVSGHLSYVSSGLDFIGEITCIRLIEGKLVVNGVIKQLNKNTRSYAYIGIGYQITFEDNGDGVSAPADRMSGVGVGYSPDCESGYNLATPIEIQGNIQIIQ